MARTETTGKRREASAADMMRRLSVWFKDKRDAVMIATSYAALVWAAIAAYFFSRGNQFMFRVGIVWSVMTFVALGLALFLKESVPTYDLPFTLDDTPTRTRIRWIPVLLGAGCLALLAEINGDVWDPAIIKHAHYHLQALLLVAGVALLGYGAAGVVVEDDEHGRSPLRRMLPRWMMRRMFTHEWGVVALILLVALVVRVYALSSAMHFFVDEVHFTNPITHFNDATDIELLLPFSSVAAFPYLYPYMQWMAAEAFGYNLVGLRLVSAIFGVMNVAALYLLARELFDRRVGWMAAALLAAFPPHMQFSRLGLNNVADPVFGTLALYFIARGLRSENWRTLRRDFVWAGVMLGLTQYWYEGGRLLYPPLVIAWGAVMLVVGYALLVLRLATAEDEDDYAGVLRIANGFNWRPLLRALAWMALVALVVALPVYYTLVGQGEGLIIRLTTAGIGGDDRFIDLQSTGELLAHFDKQFARALMLLVSFPENAHYYRGTTALLLPVMVPFFVLGVWWCLLRIASRAGASLLLVWLGLTVGGNLLMQDALISPRYVVAFPALALICALGMRAAAELLLPESLRLQTSILVMLAAGLMGVQVAYYFGIHLPEFNRQFREKLVIDDHDALLRAAELEDETVIVIVGEDAMGERDANDYMHYLNPGQAVVVIKPDDFDAAVVNAIRLTHDHAFFVEPDDLTTIKRLHAFFPQLEGPFTSSYDVPKSQQYLMYWVGKEDGIP